LTGAVVSQDAGALFVPRPLVPQPVIKVGVSTRRMVLPTCNRLGTAPKHPSVPRHSGSEKTAATTFAREFSFRTKNPLDSRIGALAIPAGIFLKWEANMGQYVELGYVGPTGSIHTNFPRSHSHIWPSIRAAQKLRREWRLVEGFFLADGNAAVYSGGTSGQHCGIGLAYFMTGQPKRLERRLALIIGPVLSRIGPES